PASGSSGLQPRPGLHPRSPAQPDLGLRLPGGHPHGGRPHPAAPLQGGVPRPLIRGDHLERGLSLQSPGL
ncbi:uncharacterized protein METZ01_LOCUS305402, partial [marine metagenome]